MIIHSDILEREIADEHEALAENLAVLESQAKDLVDWRAYVRKSPLTMIGVAFGSGLLISAIAGSKRSQPRRRSFPANSAFPCAIACGWSAPLYCWFASGAAEG